MQCVPPIDNRPEITSPVTVDTLVENPDFTWLFWTSFAFFVFDLFILFIVLVVLLREPSLKKRFRDTLYIDSALWYAGQLPIRKMIGGRFGIGKQVTDIELSVLPTTSNTRIVQQVRPRAHRRVAAVQVTRRRKPNRGEPISSRMPPLPATSEESYSGTENIISESVSEEQLSVEERPLPLIASRSKKKKGKVSFKKRKKPPPKKWDIKNK